MRVMRVANCSSATLETMAMEGVIGQCMTEVDGRDQLLLLQWVSFC